MLIFYRFLFNTDIITYWIWGNNMGSDLKEVWKSHFLMKQKMNWLHWESEWKNALKFTYKVFQFKGKRAMSRGEDIFSTWYWLVKFTWIYLIEFTFLLSIALFRTILKSDNTISNVLPILVEIWNCETLENYRVNM